MANIEIGGRKFFKSHCDTKMLKVSCADDGVSAVFEFLVCEICGYNLYSHSWADMG